MKTCRIIGIAFCFILNVTLKGAEPISQFSAALKSIVGNTEISQVDRKKSIRKTGEFEISEKWRRERNRRLSDWDRKRDALLTKRIGTFNSDLEWRKLGVAEQLAYLSKKFQETLTQEEKVVYYTRLHGVLVRLFAHTADETLNRIFGRWAPRAGDMSKVIILIDHLGREVIKKEYLHKLKRMYSVSRCISMGIAAQKQSSECTALDCFGKDGACAKQFFEDFVFLFKPLVQFFLTGVDLDGEVAPGLVPLVFATFSPDTPAGREIRDVAASIARTLSLAFDLFEQLGFVLQTGGQKRLQKAVSVSASPAPVARRPQFYAMAQKTEPKQSAQKIYQKYENQMSQLSKDIKDIEKLVELLCANVPKIFPTIQPPLCRALISGARAVGAGVDIFGIRLAELKAHFACLAKSDQKLHELAQRKTKETGRFSCPELGCVSTNLCMAKTLYLTSSLFYPLTSALLGEYEKQANEKWVMKQPGFFASVQELCVEGLRLARPAIEKYLSRPEVPKYIDMIEEVLQKKLRPVLLNMSIVLNLALKTCKTIAIAIGSPEIAQYISLSESERASLYKELFAGQGLPIDDESFVLDLDQGDTDELFSLIESDRPLEKLSKNTDNADLILFGDRKFEDEEFEEGLLV
ncbi:MAG: hypothetical protein JW725_01385 [Candidatus Babeliaceae bacterium]|nr:hypothetical protein [Candidatus Babeliaceae bacterium]